MLQDHLPCHSAGGFFSPHKTTSICCSQDRNFVAFFYIQSSFFCPLFFLFTFSVGIQVFNLFSLAPVSCITRTFLLYSQSSAWLVSTVLTINIFSFTSGAVLLAALFYITLLTSSDSWFVSSMFSSASVCTHFSFVNGDAYSL